MSLVPILSQITPVHPLCSSFFNAHFNIVLPAMPRFLYCLFPSGFPTKVLYAFLFSPSMPATCPFHPILLELLSLIMSGKEYRLRVLRYEIVSNPLLLPHSLKHSSESPDLRYPSLCPSIKLKDQDSHSYKTTGKITIYVLKQQIGRQRFLNLISADIHKI